VVGAQAAYLGRLAQQADDLGDAIGPNEFGAANHAWAAAALLREAASQRARQYREVHPDAPPRDGHASSAPPRE